MSKIPEPQRTRLIQRLSSGFGTAKIDIDDQRVEFQPRLDKPLSYRLVPFVNGTFRGAWLLSNPSPDTPDLEIGQRLLRPRLRRLFSPTELKEHNKIRRIARLPLISKEENEEPYRDLWHCPKRLVAHLEKEFDSIEVLEDGHE
jgi:hypothetical protein